MGSKMSLEQMQSHVKKIACRVDSKIFDEYRELKESCVSSKLVIQEIYDPNSLKQEFTAHYYLGQWGIWLRTQNKTRLGYSSVYYYNGPSNMDILTITHAECEAIEEVLKTRDKLNKDVLGWHYIDGLSSRDIARKFNVNKNKIIEILKCERDWFGGLLQGIKLVA